MTDPPEPLRPVPPEPESGTGNPLEPEGFDPGALPAAARTPAASSARSVGWSPPTPEDLADTLPGYRIVRLLGRGGMGAVYEGEQVSLERRVAIKLLPPELGADPEFQARFRREAKSMARLNHPNIVQIYDFGRTGGGHHYFVMEFVDGTDLHRLIRDGALDVTGALNAVSQICDALHYAHDEGFVHRDIKPANIFINRQGMVKVGDFGLAKLVEGAEADAASAKDLLDLTMTGVAVGTLNYIAPEQLVEGASVDRRADIYSLGVMFYEMLTSEVPRGAVKEPSKRVAMLDVRIDGIVFKAMDPDPSERYQTAVELRTDVDVVRTSPAVEEPVPEPATPAPGAGNPPARSRIRVAPPRSVGQTRAASGARGRRGFVAAGLALFAVLTAAAGWWLWQGPKEAGRIEEVAATVEGRPVVVSKLQPFVNSLGMKFIPIPGTTQLMCVHETRKRDYAAYAAATDGVDPSWSTAKAGELPVSPGEDHPVANVSWQDAKAFCEWLGRREGRTYRLPTDREWSRAARIVDLEPVGFTPAMLHRFPGGGPDDGWGNFADLSWKRAFQKTAGHSSLDDGFPTTAPAMSFPPNFSGFHDLKGNVREFCEDDFDGTGVSRSLRGSCWNDGAGVWARRTSRDESDRQPTDGFRCVLELAGPAVEEGRSPVFRAEGAPQRFGLSRYQLFSGASSWSEARAEAARRGGHLAVLTGEGEREWVLSHYGSALPPGGSPVWLGGYASGENCERWYWVSRENAATVEWPPSFGRRDGTEENPAFLFGSLVPGRNGSGSLVALPSRGNPGGGFLIEWDDASGDPPLAPLGPKPEAPFTNSLGMEFRPVPGTGIYLCVHETRNSDYAAFAAGAPVLDSSWRDAPSHEGIPVSPGEDHPAVQVNWFEARAFCDWLSRREGRAYRLPTDAEWSLAAGLGGFESPESAPSALGGSMSPLSLRPWGINLDTVKPGADNYFDKAAAEIFREGPRNDYWTYRDGFPVTAPVKRAQPNALGFYDLHGNVQELCEDRWRGSAPVNPAEIDWVVARGGGWNQLPKSLAERTRIEDSARFSGTGFRVALAVETPPTPPTLAERTKPVGSPRRFGSSRYQYVEGAVTWGEARVRAEQMGGRLATLAFAAEADWVAKQYGAVLDRTGSDANDASLWIGMIFHDGVRWITGESYRHSDWLDGRWGDQTRGSALANRRGAVLAKSGGKVGWAHRPLEPSAAEAPRGFLVEWDDTAGDPPLESLSTSVTSGEPFTNTLGMNFVPVPGTDILLCVHETRRRDYSAFAGEVPGLDSAWEQPMLDQTPLPQGEDDPVANVTWYEARAFCDWLGRKEGRAYRLPTDREWSLAAGLGAVEAAEGSPVAFGQRNRTVLNWGEAWPPPTGAGNFADETTGKQFRNRPFLAGYEDGFAMTAPVMRFPAVSGFHDLDGNVSEWTEDPWTASSTGLQRIARGSSWLMPQDLQLSRRIGVPPNVRQVQTGFRCAVVVRRTEASATAVPPAVVSASAPAPSPASLPAPASPAPMAPKPAVAETLPKPPAVPAPFFLGRWYQTLDGKETPVYPTDFSADGGVVALAGDGRQSSGRWSLSDTHLRIDWGNGTSHVFPLPVAKEALSLDGAAFRDGRALGSTVRLSRFEPGGAEETVLSDPSKAGDWTVIGGGGISLDGGHIRLESRDGKSGVAWYMRRRFGDFLLKTEYLLASDFANTGIMIRAPKPDGSPGPSDRGYQIDVSGVPTGKEATGAICLIQAPDSYPQRKGKNELEIEARGARFTVRVNGVVVNRFDSPGAAEGYIGLQIYKPQGITFSNLRVRELR